MWGGLVVSLRSGPPQSTHQIWSPTEYTPRPLLFHLRLPVPLSPPSSAQPMPGPCTQVKIIYYVP